VGWAYLSLVTLVVAWSRSAVALRDRMAAAAFTVAGLLAWAPNALLPNHHMAGYVWNGSYLIFSSVLLLAPLATESWGRRALGLGLMGACLLVPLSLQNAYKANAWVMEQQGRQKRLMTALQSRVERLRPGTRNVLVTGLDFPFSPFDHPNAILEFSNRLPTFSVVIYQPRGPGAAAPTPHVRFISPKEALKGQFDETWMFGPDGGALAPDVSEVDAEALRSIGLDPNALALFPAVAAAFDLAKPRAARRPILDGYVLLSCGGGFLNYHEDQLALSCLKASMQKIPDNPYPYFYSGVVYENAGDLAAARLNFGRAVSLDDRSNPNPAFKEALKRIGKGPSAPEQDDVVAAGAGG